MIKWIVTILLAIVVLSLATPWLARLGVGRLPGDFRVRWRGRDYSLPFSSTLLFCLVAWGIGRLL